MGGPGHFVPAGGRGKIVPKIRKKFCCVKSFNKVVAKLRVWCARNQHTQKERKLLNQTLKEECINDGIDVLENIKYILRLALCHQTIK